MSRAEAEPLLQGAVTPTYRAVSVESIDSLGPAELSSDAVLETFNKTFEKTFKPDTKKQSSLVTIFSVWNTIMGSSLLTMAWGVERAGLPAALVLVAFMAALCLYTAYVLLRVNKHHGSDSCEVPALCRTLLGQWAEVVAHIFSLLVLLGANIVYWILITNFLYFTVNYFVDLNSANTTIYNTSLLCPRHLNESLLIAEPEADSAYWGLHTTVPIYVALIVFPLLNFKNVSFFTKFNSLGTLSVAYLLIFVLVKGYAWGIHIGELFTQTHAIRNAAVLSGMLALSFYIHNIIITIMSNNARQDKNGSPAADWQGGPLHYKSSILLSNTLPVVRTWWRTHYRDPFVRTTRMNVNYARRLWTCRREAALMSAAISSWIQRFVKSSRTWSPTNPLGGDHGQIGVT